MQLVWFKRNLRIADNAALYEAAARGPVLPLYIVDPALWEQPDASGRQWGFLRETLIDLRAALASAGQPLIVRQGPTADVLRTLIDEMPIETVWSRRNG